MGQDLVDAIENRTELRQTLFVDGQEFRQQQFPGVLVGIPETLFQHGTGAFGHDRPEYLEGNRRFGFFDQQTVHRRMQVAGAVQQGAVQIKQDQGG